MQIKTGKYKPTISTHSSKDISERLILSHTSHNFSVINRFPEHTKELINARKHYHPHKNMFTSPMAKMKYSCCTKVLKLKGFREEISRKNTPCVIIFIWNRLAMMIC